MPINIKLVGLEEFTAKAKEAGKSLANTPVPLGKTVLTTVAIVAFGEILLARKMKFTLILTRRW